MRVTVVPVILSGGSGSRLWPLSREGYPKQFWPLVSDRTMLQETAARANGPGFAPPVRTQHEVLQASVSLAPLVADMLSSTLGCSTRFAAARGFLKGHAGDDAPADAPGGYLR